MCGIAGKALCNGGRVVADDIQRMGAVIAHRGHDDHGIYVSPRGTIGLAHQRLAIQDTSSAGHQPMSYKDRYWIVFNGEIYNFQSLRKQLVRKGHIFQSRTDTEVILALYDEHGSNCVQYLRGMFAFAIYDEAEDILFCARDRVGKKPFKYFFDGQTFLFGSELKAILTQREYKREIDYEAIHHYLTFHYCPTPFTGFVGIKKLPPAHTLTLRRSTGELRIQRYWDVPAAPQRHVSPEDWKKTIRETVTDAVRLRMIADVPVGAFLSGGVDSSIIVGLMSHISDSRVPTFSIGFQESSYNELAFARKIAQRFHTNHHELIVKPESIHLLETLARQYEEPFADSSALPTYILSQFARESVPVVLTGDGADELFGGYGRYRIHQFSMYYDRVLPLHRAIIAPLARMISSARKNVFWDRVERFSSTLSEEPAIRYGHYFSYPENSKKLGWYASTHRHAVQSMNSYQLLAERTQRFVSDRDSTMLYADFAMYLPDDLLVKTDIASMSHALEARSPFLDHILVERMYTMPIRYKVNILGGKKILLKQAFSSLIPQDILRRPKKGFGVPIDTWFRDDWQRYTASLLLSPHAATSALLDRDQVRALLHEHATTKRNYSHYIWSLVMLELWMREYFPSV